MWFVQRRATHGKRKVWALGLAGLVGLSLSAQAQPLGVAPVLTGPLRPQRVALLNSAAGLTVDTRDRAAVVRLYEAVYEASKGVSLSWNGSVPDCFAGDTSRAYKDATVLRVNYYRAMAGLMGNIVLDEAWSQKCQQAALVMSAQGQLSHTPTADWACFTAEAAEAAGHANLSLGSTGPEAVDAYVDDPGDANSVVGHRRWILYPALQRVGSGSIPASGDADFSFPPTDVLWVLDSGLTRPPGPEFVAWPPPGYVPAPVLPHGSGRWSFSIPGANFSSARVTMQSAGASISLTQEASRSGYGDNTLVWKPVLPKGPQLGVVYEVTVAGVLTGGATRSYSYTVEVIDPTELRLGARLAQNQVVLSWPAPAQSYVLEQSPVAVGGLWEKVAVTPSIVNGTMTVTLPVQPGQRYFRLRKV